MKKDSLQIGMDGVITKQENVFVLIFNEDYLNILKENFTKKVKDGVICFTGNRPASLPWRYNEDCELCKEFKARLKVIFRYLIDFGYTKFITGMAMGFDIIAIESIMELKREGAKVSLECAVPCINQTKGWKEDYQIRYQYILDNAEKVTFTSNYAYFNGCYAIRNQYMVDSADLVIGCQLKKSAGTASTLGYARKKNKNIIVFI